MNVFGAVHSRGARTMAVEIWEEGSLVCIKKNSASEKIVDGMGLRAEHWHNDCEAVPLTAPTTVTEQ